MNYTSKKAFGGYGVYDADGNQVLLFTGTGAMTAAAECAERLNNGGSLEDELKAAEITPEVVEEKPTQIVEDTAQFDEYERGSERSGRGR